MHIFLYILLGWMVFVGLVYAYLFYDIHAERLNIRQHWKHLIDAFTEEE